MRRGAPLALAALAACGGGGGFVIEKTNRLAPDLTDPRNACPELGADPPPALGEGPPARRAEAFLRAALALEAAVLRAEASVVEGCVDLRAGLALPRLAPVPKADGVAAGRACADVLRALDETPTGGMRLHHAPSTCRIDKEAAARCYADCGVSVAAEELGARCRGPGPCVDLGPDRAPPVCRSACSAWAATRLVCEPGELRVEAVDAADAPRAALLQRSLARALVGVDGGRRHLGRAIDELLAARPRLLVELAEAGGKAIACAEAATLRLRTASVGLDSTLNATERLASAVRLGPRRPAP